MLTHLFGFNVLVIVSAVRLFTVSPFARVRTYSIAAPFSMRYWATPSPLLIAAYQSGLLPSASRALTSASALTNNGTIPL